MNIGLFGGTFNPLHNGHIETIKYVADKFALKQVFFIPCAIPPHKVQKNLVSAKERFNMVDQSLKNLSGPYNFYASDIELKRRGLSFTIDTIKEFKKNLKNQNDFFLILGSDAFFDIQTWKNFKEIFNEICVIIMLRKQNKGQGKLTEKVESCILDNLSKRYQLNSAKNKFIHTTKKDIHIANVPEIAIVIPPNNTINNIFNND